MLIDMVEQYDAEKIALFRGVLEKTLLHLGQQEDHKKILSFLCKVGILDIDEHDKVVIFGVPNEFILTQVKKFFAKSLKEAVNAVYNQQFSVKFVVYSKFSASNELLIDLKKLFHIKESKTVEMKEEKKTIKTALSEFFGILFDPKFTFDNFVVGSMNNIAFSAAKAVTAQPGQAYNPLFLYGTVGLGKTHLMQAIGNDIMARFPEKVVVYLPASKLIDEIVTAIKSNKLTNVLKKFDDVDVLLIDDIQFLADKDKTQEIFHNIFNDFQLKQKQIILSSDRPPKELVHIEPRLKSRFGLGLVADVKSPDFETRIAILQSKLMTKGEDLDFNLLEIIAKYIKDNVRELE
ncbi:MAG: DnaA/Hda family protein [bacterium]